MSRRLLRSITVNVQLDVRSSCLGSSTVATATGSSAAAASATTSAAAQPPPHSHQRRHHCRPHVPRWGGCCHAADAAGCAAHSRVVAREICKLDTADDYHALLEQAEAENRVVVIKFYASWCRACKAMAPKFAKMADEWPDIEFVSALPFSAC